jgi:hypothetical protein
MSIDTIAIRPMVKQFIDDCAVVVARADDLALLGFEGAFGLGSEVKADVIRPPDRAATPPPVYHRGTGILSNMRAYDFRDE